MYCILANVVFAGLQHGVQYFCNRLHHNTFFSPQQVRKRHCFSKEVQLVDASEVYNQRKNGELVVHSEKSVKNTSPKTVSNVETALMPWLLGQGQFSEMILTWAFVWLRVAFILIAVCFHFNSCFPVLLCFGKRSHKLWYHFERVGAESYHEWKQFSGSFDVIFMSFGKLHRFLSRIWSALCPWTSIGTLKYKGQQSVLLIFK